jgi:hypothetical protein
MNAVLTTSKIKLQIYTKMAPLIILGDEPRRASTSTWILQLQRRHMYTSSIYHTLAGAMAGRIKYLGGAMKPPAQPTVLPLTFTFPSPLLPFNSLLPPLLPPFLVPPSPILSLFSTSSLGGPGTELTTKKNHFFRTR